MKRFQFSLRLLLLMRTLCVVIVVWLKARHDLWETELRGKLKSLEISREQNMFRLKQPIYKETGSLPEVVTNLKMIDTEIKQVQQQLGLSNVSDTAK